MEVVPDQLEDGVLYVCERYRTVLHKCCCGCGEEVVTPLSPVDWSVRKEGETVTLSPSIGNWSFACRSHYLIIKNQIVWAAGMTQAQIARVKSRDKTDKAIYLAELNAENDSINRVSWSFIIDLIRKLFA